MISEKRKQIVGSLFVLALTVLMAAFAIRQSGGQSVIWEPFRSIVQLQMLKWSGSGTLIAVSDGKGLILSCRHVARKVGTEVKLKWVAIGQETSGEVIEVVPKTGKSSRKRRGNSSWGNDLALIEAGIPEGLEPVPVAKFDPDNGPWTCRGFRGGTAYTAVTDEAEERDDGRIILSALFWGGESGGAVLDKYGHLVGVIVASNTKGAYGVAANGEALRTLLEKYNK